MNYCLNIFKLRSHRPSKRFFAKTGSLWRKHQLRVGCHYYLKIYSPLRSLLQDDPTPEHEVQVDVDPQGNPIPNHAEQMNLDEGPFPQQAVDFHAENINVI